MPGEDFPYYITRSPYKSYSPLGFLFKHYDHRNSSLPNDIIQQTLVEAGHKIEEQLIQNPILENQTLDDKWLYIQEEQKYMIGFVPNEREITYGDISTIIPLISTWATQYAGVECDFDIWLWPRTSAQRKLGTGHLAHVTNLPNMPGGYGFIFPYHMTPDNSLGLVFNHYDLSPLDNDVIEEALVEATNRYDREIAGDPTLANQTLDRQWQYDHNPHDQGEDYYTLFINPVDPAMTYGDIPTLIAVLAEWATQYQTCKTDFHIYARPGTGEERRLGWGNILQII